VEKWAATFNLQDAWIKEEVFSTLRFWLQPLCPRTAWYFRGPDPAEVTPPPIPRLTIDEEWSGGPWPEIRKRLLTKIAEYKSQIDHHQELVRLFRGQVVIKRLDHYRWLALFQCGRLSPAKIRDQTQRNPPLVVSTVSHAIDGLIVIIGLKKRRRLSGRPRKTKRETP
jgi:hypothetical protein